MQKGKVFVTVVVAILSVFTVLFASPVSASSTNYLLKARNYHNLNKLKRADVLSGGASFTDLRSVMIRQLLNQCPGETPRATDPVDKEHINVVKDEEHKRVIRLRLAPETTPQNCRDASEIYLGQSNYLDQQGLVDAAARNDIRVFQPGKEMTFYGRFSQAYQAKTALGTGGFIAQSWEFNATNPGIPAFIIAGFVYVPSLPQMGLPAGVYMVVGDFSTGFLDLFPAYMISDISVYHNYSIKWAVGNVFTFSVDGNVVRTVNATAMRTSGNLIADVGVYIDNNDFSAGFAFAPTGSMFTQEQIIDIRTVGVNQL